MTDLKALMVDVKEAWINYDDEFKVLIALNSKKAMADLYKSCLEKSRNPRTKQLEETLDKDKWAEEFVKATVKDWKGLKAKQLGDLIMIDTSKIKDPDAEVEFSVENAKILLENSTEFDSFVQEAISDLTNFR